MKRNLLIILANGESKRIQYNKNNLFIKNNILIDHYIKNIFNKKNYEKIYINNKIKIYINIPDIIYNIGPIGAIYSIIKYLKKKKNLLLLPIDNIIISYKFINIFFKWKKKYKIIIYKNNFFPMLLKINYKKYEIIKIKNSNNSIIKFINSKNTKKIIYKTRKKLLININYNIIWIKIKYILEQKNNFIFKNN